MAAERVKDTFIRTKDEAQRGASSAEDSPEKYAADITVLQVTSESLFTWIKEHQYDWVGVSRDYGGLSAEESDRNYDKYPICLKLLKQLGSQSAFEKLKAGVLGDNLSITATCIKAF